MQWPNEEKKSKNDIQSITQETKDCAARTLQSTGVGKQFPSRGHTVSASRRPAEQLCRLSSRNCQRHPVH
jgi:hypothetical protein